MTIAKHLTKILETKKIKIIPDKETLFRVDEPFKKVAFTLSGIYVTHLFEGDHKCKCPTCQLAIMKALKEKAIDEVKKVESRHPRGEC